MNKYARVKIENFTNKVDQITNAHKRRLETMKGKSQIAIDMVQRAVNNGIYADYLLVDSWYSKPVFIKEMNELGLKVISRIANSNTIWNFIGKEKTRYRKFRVRWLGLFQFLIGKVKTSFLVCKYGRMGNVSIPHR